MVDPWLGQANTSRKSARSHTFNSFPRARPWGLYLYQYLDADNGQRVLDSWSAWEWSTALGTPIGITGSGTGDSLYIYTVAFGADAATTFTVDSATQITATVPTLSTGGPAVNVSVTTPNGTGTLTNGFTYGP